MYCGFCSHSPLSAQPVHEEDTSACPAKYSIGYHGITSKVGRRVFGPGQPTAEHFRELVAVTAGRIRLSYNRLGIAAQQPARASAGTMGARRGCTLASAIAACLAREMDLESAAQDARDYVFEAISSAPALGSTDRRAHGPLNHGIVPIGDAPETEAALEVSDKKNPFSVLKNL